MSTAGTRPVAAGGAGFEDAARQGFVRFRAAVVALFAALPAGVRSATDVHRSLKVDSKTGWRLFRIASASDPLAVGVHLPGRASVERALRAAEGAEVPGPTLQAVRDAFDEIEDLIERYAGDRTTFDSMVSAFADDAADQVDLQHRRAAFRANSHLLGVQSSATMATHIVHPNLERPGLLDSAAVTGAYDQRLLRADAIPTTYWYRTTVEQEPVGQPPEPIGGAGADPTGFLPEFSQGAVARTRLVEWSEGRLELERRGEMVGVPSSSTTAFAHVARCVAPPYRTESDEYYRASGQVLAPTAVTFLTVLLHADTFGTPAPATHHMLGPNLPDDFDPRACPANWRLPASDHAKYVGRGLAALHTPELPRYSELMTWALRRLGWDPESFNVYRLRVEYPILYSKLMVEMPLPEHP